jgi:hypothetical protein
MTGHEPEGRATDASVAFRVTRWGRLLTFRADGAELDRLDRHDLALGLVATWIVGMGRYWDDPGARLAQHLGLGSVVYVFALSLLLWLVIGPLGPRRWSYRGVLTFVALVSPPAILYAFPIERLVPLETARTVNAWFLGIVATWRVALLFYFLRVAGRLGAVRIAVGSLLPLTLLVASLAALNLERVVFQIMGGLRSSGNPNDTAYLVLLVITFFSTWAFIPLLIAYVSLIVITVRRRRAGASTA